MKLLTFPDWYDHYQPILNEYVVLAGGVHGILFNKDLLAQIAGAITEKSMWTYYYEDIPTDLENMASIRTYKIKPGTLTASNVIGYLVTKIPWKTSAIEVDKGYDPVLERDAVAV